MQFTTTRPGGITGYGRTLDYLGDGGATARRKAHSRVEECSVSPVVVLAVLAPLALVGLAAALLWAPGGSLRLVMAANAMCFAIGAARLYFAGFTRSVVRCLLAAVLGGYGLLSCWVVGSAAGPVTELQGGSLGLLIVCLLASVLAGGVVTLLMAGWNELGGVYMFVWTGFVLAGLIFAITLFL